MPPRNWKRRGSERTEISGFWNREGEIEGTYLKTVKTKESSFFLVTLTVAADNVSNNDSPVSVPAGGVIGVSSNFATECLGELDAGTPVKLKSNGKKVNPKNDREYWDIEVFVDEGNVPF